jgi:CheY-like chemotaxis protein
MARKIIDDKRGRILVVEDDGDIAHLLESILQLQGYEVALAANGLEGLEHVSSHLPDLILLDMKMPIMDGWEFAKAFREKHDHLVPIVVVTAAGDAREWAHQVEAKAWVGKPFQLNQLLSVVEEVAGETPGH